jgi:hypothetical protein
MKGFMEIVITIYIDSYQTCIFVLQLRLTTMVFHAKEFGANTNIHTTHRTKRIKSRMHAVLTATY